MKNTHFLHVTILLLVLAPAWPASAETPAAAFDVRPGFRVITSIAEFRQCLAASGAQIRMKPGAYTITDAAPGNKEVFLAGGSNNAFDLRGVTLQLDTRVLAGMRGRTHELTAYRILGSGLTFEGATFEDIGDQIPYQGLSDFDVTGDRNTFKDCTFIVRGSAPYGYGDLFGKGSNHKVTLHKHAAMSVVGDETRIIGCTFSIHTFGHAIHMHGAQNTLVQDTAIEGALRLSDDILAETTGTAVNLGFVDLFGRPITRGRMICLAEDGIRAYNNGVKNGQTRRTSGITVIGCTVRRMRGGITLALASGNVAVRDCTVTGSGYPGHAYSLPAKAVVRNCRGDAAYAPLLLLGYTQKTNADIELELMDAPRYCGNDQLALINGSGHKVKIVKPDGKPLAADLKIFCGQTYRNDEADIGATYAKGITLVNQTRQPVLLTDVTSGCAVDSQAPVDDRGKNNVVRRLPD